MGMTTEPVMRNSSTRVARPTNANAQEARSTHRVGEVLEAGRLAHDVGRERRPVGLQEPDQLAGVVVERVAGPSTPTTRAAVGGALRDPPVDLLAVQLRQARRPGGRLLRAASATTRTSGPSRAAGSARRGPRRSPASAHRAAAAPRPRRSAACRAPAGRARRAAARTTTMMGRARSCTHSASRENTPRRGAARCRVCSSRRAPRAAQGGDEGQRHERWRRAPPTRPRRRWPA